MSIVESGREKFCGNHYVFSDTPSGELDCTIRIIEGGVQFVRCPYETTQDAVEGRLIDGERKYACMDYEPLEPEVTVQIR